MSHSELRAAARPPLRDAEAAWRALQHTAALVRRGLEESEAARPSPRALRRRMARAARAGAALLALGALAHGMTGRPLPAHADGGADAALFSLTNQDRSSNGLAALQSSGTLQAIGENRPYGGCGVTVDGRSYDMIVRNYFSHQILGCGQYVFSMMSAAGVPYRSAGENIGWDAGVSGSSEAASYINTEFMNSPEHRANILNGSYTHLGVGSWLGGSWTGAGSPQSNAWMFSEEFAQLSVPPPAPPAPPPPPPAPTTVRNQPAPRAPLAPVQANTAPAPGGPAPGASGGPPTTDQPVAAPPPTAEPLPTPAAGAAAGSNEGAAPPLQPGDAGLLRDTIEAVLEGFLID